MRGLTNPLVQPTARSREMPEASIVFARTCGSEWPDSRMHSLLCPLAIGRVHRNPNRHTDEIVVLAASTAASMSAMVQPSPTIIAQRYSE